MIEEIWALIIDWCLKSKKWKCKQQKKRQRKKQEKTKDKYKNWEKNQTPQTTKLGHRGEPRTGEQAQERRRYRVTVAAFTRSLYGSLFRLKRVHVHQVRMCEPHGCRKEVTLCGQQLKKLQITCEPRLCMQYTTDKRFLPSSQCLLYYELSNSSTNIFSDYLSYWSDLRKTFSPQIVPTAQ